MAVGIGALVISGALVGCGGGDDDDGPAITVTRPVGDLANGAKIYTTFCAACHGESGMGDGPGAAATKVKPRDLTSEPYKIVKPSGAGQTEAQALIEYIKVGNLDSGMPAYGTMPAKDLADVAAYVMSIRPEPGYYAESDE